MTEENSCEKLLDACVVIPTFNRSWECLERSISSVLPQLEPHDKLIVVDQNDSVIPELMEYQHQYEAIEIVWISEKGLPNARNVGLARAPEHCKLIVFCDDDVEVDSKWLLEHKRSYTSPGIGAVGGLVIESEQGASEKRRNAVGMIRRFDAGFAAAPTYDHIVEVDTTHGCNMSFRRTALEKAGGFDKRFGGNAHLEESDVCMTIKEHGFSVLYNPRPVLRHLRENTGGCRNHSNDFFVFWYSHNYTLFFLKHFNHWFFPLFLFQRFLRFIYWGLRQGSPRPLFTGVKGIRSALKNVNNVKRRKKN